MRITRNRLLVAIGVSFLLVLIPWVAIFKNSGTSFNATALAQSETRMWKAYYDRDLLRLRGELRRMLREQFGLSRYRTWQVSARLATASLSFARSGDGQAAEVLRDLTEAYRGIQAATGLDFDPAEAARAELGWWAARRTPGENQPEQVGARIEALYAILYGHTNALIAQAALLRAEAAHVRDTRSDWPEVERLLEQSYRSLLAGMLP